MTVDLVVAGGQVVVPGKDPQKMDISVAGGKIVGLHAPGQAPEAAARVVDAAGLHVLPGLIDAHIHLGNFNDLVTDVGPGTQMAALGGVTTLVNYFKATGSYLDLVPGWIETFETHSYVDAAFHLQLLVQKHLDELVETSRQFGITSYKVNLVWKGKERAVFDSDRPVDNGWVWSCMEAMQKIDPEAMVMNIHCENEEIKNEARRRIGRPAEGDLALYEALAPDVSEVDSVLSMLALAAYTGTRTYLVHLSAAWTCEILASDLAAKGRIAAETCPHYLVHTVDSPAGLLATVSPPVRRAADRDALWAAVADGRIDVIGSDSNPMMLSYKMGDAGFRSVRPGFDGVGQILPAVLSAGHHDRGIPLGRLAQVLSENPARIFGLYPQKGTIAVGSDADLVLVDLDKVAAVGDEAIGPHVDFSIYTGMEFRGWPVATVARGEVLVEAGRFVGAAAPRGRYLRRQVAS